MPWTDPLPPAVWEYVSRLAYELAWDLNETSQQMMIEALQRFMQTPGMTMGDLREGLANIYGEERANRIAVTEVTRAYVQGAHIGAEQLRSTGWDVREIWRTSNDDLVCEICGPLNNADVTNGDRPPAHPNCRCAVEVEIAGLT